MKLHRPFSVAIAVCFFVAIGAVASPLSAQVKAPKPFYNIAHMTNTPALVDWAVRQGANGLEVDLKFGDDGEPSRFKHGGLCDCSCPGYRSVCYVEEDTCGASSNTKALLAHIARRRSVALLIVDSKVTAKTDEAAAGKAVVRLLETELFSQGFDGKVIISVASPDRAKYIAAASKQADKSVFRQRIYFSFDQATGQTPAETLAQLKSISSRVSYGYGISACWFRPDQFAKLRSAGELRNKAGGIVYGWTYESTSSMLRLIDEGVNGIITNEPERLARLVKEERGKVRLARPGDDFPGQGRRP